MIAGAALLLWMTGRASAQEDAAALEFASLPETIGWAGDVAEIELAIPRFVAPGLDRSGAAERRAEREGLRLPRLETIRQNLAAPASASQERAVGWRLGMGRMALSTSFVTGAGSWQRSDTRFDWGLSRGASADETGLVWNLGTGGAFGMAGRGEQRASALVGYRSTLFDKVTLSSGVAFATTYAFAANEAAISMAPQLRLVAKFDTAIDTPWTTQLDVRLKRELPLTEGAYQTQASAMLRLRYALD